MRLSYKDTGSGHEEFQYLEDLATAYWYSEVLFTGMELNVFKYLAKGPSSLSSLVKQTGWDRDGLARLLAVLVALGLMVEFDTMFTNSPLADRYLVPGRDEYMGDFIEYRRYIAPHWQRLTSRIREGITANERPTDEPHDAYEKRVFNYVQAMDVQARFKAIEVLEYIDALHVTFPKHILDIGGGAGAWCRTFLKHWPQADAVLFDLPEILAAACRLYTDPGEWTHIKRLAGDILHPCIKEGVFDLVILSNILHVYSEKEATMILKTARRCLGSKGMVLIHDYLLDENGTDPLKGRLYDLHMMLNTYNGRIYSKEKLTAMLGDVGLQNTRAFQLCSDTWAIMAKRGKKGSTSINRLDMLEAKARRLGFEFARVIETREVCVRSWVRVKCRFGCQRYGLCHTCPPHALDEEKMKKILLEYTHALLVQGIPPAKRFHGQLLELERHLFLAGYTKTLAFGAGPCPVCPECVTDSPCRFPQKARPSMEACGVDVYTTAKRAGLNIAPVKSDHGYVKYVGLVLIQ
ncbi:MAG: DUF2284 domain-containing protein [Thermodesulfobacteriota bacterium]|nr:DUF2284 domain-containing protein [Thermodesulfobacteriota bacterium]